MNDPFRPSGRGFALVSALWAVMILAVIVASVLLTVRTDARLSRNGRELAALGELAEAGINMQLLRLVEPGSSVRPPVDGSTFTVSVDGQPVELSVQDEAGKIDLNQASADALVRLLTTAGMDAFAAEALTDKILDWREPGSDKRLNGAKRDDYRAAGYAYGPRLGPFESIEELQLVMDMTRSVFERTAPSLTVYAQSPTIDPTVAPPSVLAALPGFDEERIAAILAERGQRRAVSFDGSMGEHGPEAAVVAGRVFSIAATVRGRDLMRARREAVVRITGLLPTPYWVYRWR